MGKTNLSQLHRAGVRSSATVGETERDRRPNGEATPNVRRESKSKGGLLGALRKFVSRKLAAAVGGVVAGWLAIVHLDPEISARIVELIELAIMTYVGGQAAVDVTAVVKGTKSE